ncbi:MAG: hypothetical protein LBG44_05970 [Gemmatimonadota bacterium]|jgi:hypothetical protein|nr:hypothetical protein [Gemmatimonadota bacterium]
MPSENLIFVAFLGLALAGCDQASSASAEARQLADKLTGDADGDAKDNAQCRMFTRAEIAVYADTPVEAGRNAALGTGCQWLAQNENGFVMVQIVRAQDHNPPSAAPGFRELPGVGSDGFVINEEGSWSAGAIQDGRSINVEISTGAGEVQALALLREAMKRATVQ